MSDDLTKELVRAKIEKAREALVTIEKFLTSMNKTNWNLPVKVKLDCELA